MPSSLPHAVLKRRRSRSAFPHRTPSTLRPTAHPEAPHTPRSAILKPMAARNLRFAKQRRVPVDRESLQVVAVDTAREMALDPPAAGEEDGLPGLMSGYRLMYGGWRWLIRCPECGGRRERLYQVGEKLACRSCNGVRYWSMVRKEARLDRQPIAVQIAIRTARAERQARRRGPYKKNRGGQNANGRAEDGNPPEQSQ